MFLDYINESSEVNTGHLDEYLTSIKDLGIEYQISPVSTLTNGKFAGRSCVTVQFNLEKLHTINMSPVIDREMISDDRIWEFLDELISFKNRVDSDKVALHFSPIGAHWRIGISFLVGQESTSGKEFELLKLYNEIRTRHLRGKSDFHNSMTDKIENNRVIINVSGDYTDRKLNLFLRGIDLSGFDINIKKRADNRMGYAAEVVFTQK